MPCTEAYKEQVMYTFNGFCKTDIRYAALHAWRDRSRRRQKETGCNGRGRGRHAEPKTSPAGARSTAAALQAFVRRAPNGAGRAGLRYVGNVPEEGWGERERGKGTIGALPPFAETVLFRMHTGITWFCAVFLYINSNFFRQLSSF